MTDTKHMSAIFATWATWFAWFTSHIDEINKYMQLAVLALGLVTGAYALAWQIRHRKDNFRDEPPHL